MLPVAEPNARQAVVARLSREFQDVGPAEIERKVSDEFTGRSDVRITQFVPVLVERAVRRELQSQARRSGPRSR